MDGYDLGPDIHSKLDELCNLIPELGVLHAWTQDDWASTIYELMLLAKGTFLKQAAALWTRSVGRNGKDTLCNLMGSILGSYAVTIDASTFSKIRNPNAPSPVYALCRARRFVSIREVDGSTRSSPTRSGRDLYEPPPLVSDYAVRQRTAIVEHISVFTDNPVEANQKTWVPVEDTIRSTAILHMVYKRLLKDRATRSIGPIPTKCLALLKVEVKDEVGDLVRSFLSTKTERAPGASSADSREDIHAACESFIKATRQEHEVEQPGKRVKLNVADLLKSAGVVERRSKAASVCGKRINVHFLMYRFEDAEGKKDLNDSFIRLVK